MYPHASAGTSNFRQKKENSLDVHKRSIDTQHTRQEKELKSGCNRRKPFKCILQESK